ncbi:MAG: DUF5131 family protein [Thermoplasmata archaeon]|nr:DUF5131 family protein [Thermoplasmata archaeon]
MSNPRNWNPWHGCRRYSEGCENCYMFYLDQMRGVPENSSNIYRTRDASKPLAKDSKGHFKIPSGFEISINMTSDTFLEEADDWRGDMWRIIRKRPDLIFYILTKRVHRVEQCLPEDWGEGYENVMMNISVENQRAFDERWPVLEKIPAKHKGINIAPMLSEIDISPALASGQIERVNLSGEGFDGRRPCRYEWIKHISDECSRYQVNLVINMVGSVFVWDGSVYESRTFKEQADLAQKTGLSLFFGKPVYKLYSPHDGHLLKDEELLTPVFNRDRCMDCPNLRVCSGCTDCGSCKNVVLVDIEGKPVCKTKSSGESRMRSMSLEDFL